MGGGAGEGGGGSGEGGAPHNMFDLLVRSLDASSDDSEGCEVEVIITLLPVRILLGPAALVHRVHVCVDDLLYGLKEVRGSARRICSTEAVDAPASVNRATSNHPASFLNSQNVSPPATLQSAHPPAPA